MKEFHFPKKLTPEMLKGARKLEAPGERSTKHRIPLEILKELGEKLKKDFNLPNVYLAGSQSPKYPKLPRENSDIDFVCFPLDYKEKEEYYKSLHKRWKIESKHPLLNGRWVCLGIFDPTGSKLYNMSIKGKSPNWWRQFNVRLDSELPSSTVLTNGGNDPNFGYEQIGGTGKEFIHNYIRGSKFVCPSSGTADSITAYLSYSMSFEGDVKCAIYDSNYSFVGATEQRHFIKTGEGIEWETFNFASPKPPVYANVTYWLVIWAGFTSGAGFEFYYGNGDTDQGMYQNLTYGSWPSTLTPTLNNNKHSIYCSYNALPIYKTITSNARIKVPKTATINGNARIKITQPKTITGAAQIVFSQYETIGANARIKAAISKTITGNARVKILNVTNTITSNARIAFVYYATMTANARIKVPILKTIAGTALIKKTLSQTTTGTAKIVFRHYETINGNARIKAVNAKTISGNALVCFRYYKTIPGNAYVESIQWYDTLLSYRFDRENVARAIGGVVNSIGREWWVNFDDILCVYNQRGHDKSATVTLSDDITSIDQSFDASKIINKLTVVGMGPGSSHLEVTVEDLESQEKYGVMEGVFSEKDIHDIDTLTAFAYAALAQTVEAKHRMIVNLIGTERTDIELGDIVHVADPDAAIDGNYRIISMARISGTSGESTELEIAVPQFRVTETLVDAERRADATDYHPQGAPSIITHDKSENVDAAHSLSLKFYIPEEAVDMGKLQIKEAKVALVLEPFRAHSTGAAAGGGQTTSAGGGQTTSSGGGQTTSSGGGQTSSSGSSHSHSITGQTAENSGFHGHLIGGYVAPGSGGTSRKFGGYNSNYSAVYFYLNTEGSGESLYTNQSGYHTHPVTGTTSSSESSHTHTVSDHTHTVANHTHSVSDHTHSVSNHTHDIVYGIYTSTSPANVYIKLNGTQIAGPFNVDTFADITDAFLEQIATYGWNTLEFTSTQLGKIGATLFMRLFLQAS